MVLQYIFVLALAGLSYAKPGEHTGDVDGAIEHVEWQYSDALCLDLLLVDCATHVTQGDEQICGTDGKTYDNHCKFVHAVCEYFYSKVTLTVQNHGPCPLVVSTTPATTAPPVTGSSMAPVASSSPAVAMTTTTGGATGGVTSGPVTTQTVTTTMPPTTTVMVTTTNANHQIIQNVFCLNADNISCSASGVDVICGSNGVLYANQCEFAKAHCKITTLQHADPASCTAPATGGR